MVITNGFRKVVKAVNVLAVQGLPHLGEEHKYSEKVMFYPMQTTSEATYAYHGRYLVWLLQKSSGLSEVAHLVQDSGQVHRHDFGITHLAFKILPVMNRLQLGVTNAVNDHDLFVRESLFLLTGWFLLNLA